MARPDDPIITQIVKEIAEIGTLFEDMLVSVKQASQKMSVKTGELAAERAEFSRSVREGASLLVSLKDAVELLCTRLSTVFSDAGELPKRQAEAEIWKIAEEAARGGFTSGAELAIQTGMAKAFWGLKDEIREIGGLLSQLRKERRKSARSVFVDKLTEYGAAFLLGLWFLALAGMVFWFSVGGPFAKSIASDGEKAREYDLICQHVDEPTRAKMALAYQSGVKSLEDKAEAAAHQAELDAAAEKSRRVAAEAKGKADQAEYEAIARANQLQTMKIQLESEKAAQDYRQSQGPRKSD